MQYSDRLSSFFKDYEDTKKPIMQYIGLKDKNDQEIYEGDIIGFQYYTGHSYRVAGGIVRYGEYLAGTNDYGNIWGVGFFVEQVGKNLSHEWNMRDTEIVHGAVAGNIYENPELLDA